jgi:hypothetical protein
MPAEFDAEEVTRKALAWVDEHWRGAAGCSVCGGTGWIVRAPVRLAPLGAPAVPGGVHPVVPLACRACGNLRFLDAFVAGILPTGATDPDIV